MSIRFVHIVFACISVGVFLVGYVMTNSIQYGICTFTETVTDATCINFYDKVGDPLFYGFGALSLVLLALLAFPRATRPWWKYFAIWYIPLALALFIIWPEPRGGMGVVPSVLGPAPEAAFRWISGIFLVVSAGIVALATSRPGRRSS